MAREVAEREPRGASRRIIFRYLASPEKILGDGHVTGVRLVHNDLSVGPDGLIRVRPTGVRETLATGLVLSSVGCFGSAIPGLPFDEKAGVILHVAGRVIDPRTQAHIRGEYVSG
jgi:ferredoxin--NADP+ reductase